MREQPLALGQIAPHFLAATAGDGLRTLVGVADQGWGMDDDHNGWAGGGWLNMMGFMALFWIVIAILVVWAVRTWGGGRPGEGRVDQESPRSPLDIACERYARGEINDEEFERIRQGLRLN